MAMTRRAASRAPRVAVLLGAAFALWVLSLAVAAPRAGSGGSCSRPGVWCGDFTGGSGFSPWDGLDGNVDNAAQRSRYFRIIRTPTRLPVGHAYFRATVDAGAVDDSEFGQRTKAYLFPTTDLAEAKTHAWEGSEAWYHTSVRFPRGFRPSPDTDWNWVVEWHYWPDSVRRPGNVAITVDANRRHHQRLVMYVVGGGDADHPVDRYSNDPFDDPAVKHHIYPGTRTLRRGHWYDMVVHIRWSYQRDRGQVQWWLDGCRVLDINAATLYWYRDNDQDNEGDTPGPGQAYWMLGYYRPDELPNGNTDRSTAAVDHNGARIGPTRGSVAYGPTKSCSQSSR